MKIKLTVDKVSVNGPRIDGGYTIKFDVGEHEQQNVAQLVALPQNETLKVEVNYDKE